MDEAQIQALPPAELAAWVRAQDPALGCALPLNGTRRWWCLRQPEGTPANDEAGLERYMRDGLLQQIAVQRLLFEHGVHTIACPIMGGRLIAKRSEAYGQAVFASLDLLARLPELDDFYAELGVRVRFYGNYAGPMAERGYGELVEQTARVMEATAGNDRHLLLYGLWAEDSVEAAATRAVAFFQRTGRVPGTEELVQEYYGLPVPPLRLYIGFDKPKTYDVPLLLTRKTYLYFPAVPTLALDAPLIRTILFDALVARQAREVDPLEMTPEQRETLRRYYARNQGQVAGVGRLDPLVGCWVPAWEHVAPGPAAAGETAGAPPGGV